MKPLNKIFKRIPAFICVAVFTISNIVMPVSAAFLGAASLPALFTLLAAVLVAAGINSQTEVDGMTRSELLNSYSEHRHEIAEKQAAEDWADGWYIIKDALQDFINDYSCLSDVPFGSWVDDHQDDVLTGSSVDLNGHGALLVGKKLDATSNPVSMWYYCDYIICLPAAGSPPSLRYDTYNTHIISYSLDGSIYQENSSGGSFSVMPLFMNQYSWSVYGDVFFEDGSVAEDYITDNESVPLPIGTVTIDGVEYPVSDDGTVVVDGVTYTINEDGSITIGDTTYYPDYDLPYDDTALIDLLSLLLSLLDDATVPDDSVSDTSDDIIENIEPVVIADSDFGQLTMDKSIATVFPFCIPFDFYNGLKLLATDPVAPRFEVPFEIPQYGSFPGFKKMIIIDFSEYDKYFYVVRWGMFAIAMFGMCFLTFKIVKGAN